MKNNKAIKADINRRLEWQIWLISVNSPQANESNESLNSRRDSFFSGFEGFGRRSFQLPNVIRRRTLSQNSIKVLIV